MFFHFIQDILHNIRIYGLYKKDSKKINDKIVNIHLKYCFKLQRRYELCRYPFQKYNKKISVI